MPQDVVAATSATIRGITVSVVLRGRVGIMDGATRIGAKPAILDLHDDGRFVLARIDPRSGEVTEMVIDTPIGNVSVNRATTYLAITAGSVTKKVDFSGETPAGMAMALGAFGMELSRISAEKAGIKDWVAAFKTHGVFRGYGINRRNLIVLMVVGVVVASVVVALLVGNVAF